MFCQVNVFVGFSLATSNSPDPVDVKTGFQTVDVWSKTNQQTAYAQTALTAGMYSFVSLLVPVKMTDLPDNVKQQSFTTALTQSAHGGVTASVSWDHCTGSSYCDTTLQLTLHGNGTWAASRSALREGLG